MSATDDPRDAAACAHAAFVLASLIGDSICGLIPGPGEEADDEAVDLVLDDVDQIRLAVGRLIDLLRVEHPKFAAEYAAHEKRMKAAGARHDYARELLKLSGHDPDAEDEQKGGAA